EPRSGLTASASTRTPPRAPARVARWRPPEVVSTVDDHYATLRVRPSASRAEIERAYRRLARRYHPDLLGGAGQEARRRAEATLKRVNAAYTVIGDPQRRLAYDRQLAERRARAMAH